MCNTGFIFFSTCIDCILGTDNLHKHFRPTKNKFDETIEFVTLHIGEIGIIQIQLCLFLLFEPWYSRHIHLRNEIKKLIVKFLTCYLHIWLAMNLLL